MEEINNEQTEQVTQEQPTDVALEEINKAPEAQASPHANNAQEVNITRMREAKERAERENAELAERLSKYEQQAAEPEYGADDLVEGKHLKKEMDGVKAQLKAYQQKTKDDADEYKLRSTYTDFDKVFNAENIARLKESDPEFAEAIASSQSSLYSRCATTYKKIKDMGLYVEDKHVKEKAKAQENAAKPRPMNSVSPQQGDSPLSMANAFANGLTPDLKKQLWKEMQNASKKH